MQTSVDRGQLRLLRVPRSGVPDVLLVERRDVLVPEARDRHVEDVLRQNVKRMRRRSARRLRIVHLLPRETHRMEPAGNGVPPRGVRNPFRPVIAARTEEQIAGTEPRSLRADGQSSSAARPTWPPYMRRLYAFPRTSMSNSARSRARRTERDSSSNNTKRH